MPPDFPTFLTRVRPRLWTAGLREKLRAPVNQRRRFGYCRLHILLRREGVMINHKLTSASLTHAMAEIAARVDDYNGE
jgi:hypothetical protein